MDIIVGDSTGLPNGSNCCECSWLGFAELDLNILEKGKYDFCKPEVLKYHKEDRLA